MELWGASWCGSSALLVTDNAPAVFQLAKQSCSWSRPDVLYLILRACHLSIEKEFHYFAEHLAGEKNVIADALSRFSPDPFQSLCKNDRKNIAPRAETCDSLLRSLFCACSKLF